MSSGLKFVRLPNLARVLLVGPDAPGVLKALGFALPGLFDASVGPAGELAQIAPGQYLLSALPARPTELPALATPATTLCLPTEYGEFAVLGTDWEALLPEITTADSAASGASPWFATQVCGLDAVVRRGTDGFRVICAPAEAAWLGATLEGLVLARGGQAAPIDDYPGLAARH